MGSARTLAIDREIEPPVERESLGETDLLRDGIGVLVGTELVGSGCGVGSHVGRVTEFEAVLWHRV